MRHDRRLPLHVAAVLAALALLRPASAQPTAPPGPATACTADVCKITVSVVGHCRAPDGIVVAPLLAATNQPLILRFKVSPGSCEFHDDGIAFDEIAQFEPPAQPDHPSGDAFPDSKVKGGDFRYRVRLRGCPEAEGFVRHK